MMLRANCTAVAIGGRAILIEGPSGSGKSSLALALIDRGAMLVGDDGVALRIADGRLLAGPPPATRGQIEIRNVGIAEMECMSAPIALLIRLADNAPRFIEGPEWTEIETVALPTVSLFPQASALPLRAEWALRLHGLDLSPGGALV